MRRTIEQTRCRQIYLMGILLLVALVMHPVVAGAELLAYKYTGNPFQGQIGTFPANPAIGTHLEVTFYYDGILTAPLYDISYFRITCGDLRMDSASLDPSYVMQGNVWLVDSYGLPSAWHFRIGRPWDGTTGWFMVSESHLAPFMVDQYAYDSVDLMEDGALVGATVTYMIPGTWSWAQVPVPQSLVLLGSGLIPMVWWRRRNRVVK